MRLSLKKPTTALALVALAATGAFAQVGGGGGDDVGSVPPPRTGPVTFYKGEVVERLADRADGQTQHEERLKIPVPSAGPDTIYTMTNLGGTVYAAHLQNERYQRDPLPEFPGIPEEKRAGGPIDVVSNWSPSVLPFRAAFSHLGVAEKMTRIVRRAQSGTIKDGRLVSPTRAESRAFTVDRPVRKGDILAISAPPELAGDYVVGSVGQGGSIAPEEAKSFPVKDATGLVYEVRREGAILDLFQVDPGFTRVSDKPGFPVVYVWPDPKTDTSSVFLEKRFEVGAHPYELLLSYTIHNFGREPVKVGMGLSINGWQHPATKSSNPFSRPTNIESASCRTNESLEHVQWPSLHEEAVENFQKGQAAQAKKAFVTPTDWIAVGTTYFEVAAVPVRPTPGGECVLSATLFDAGRPGAWTLTATYMDGPPQDLTGVSGGCVPSWLGRADAPSCESALKALGLEGDASRAEVKAAWSRLRSEGGDTTKLDTAQDAFMNRCQFVYRFKLYLGPKDGPLLELTAPALRDSQELGMFGFISKPLHSILVWFYGGLGSWALAIIMLTILVKLVLLPLTNKSYRSMQKMQLIKPKLDALKREHGSDRQAFAKEQMALFKREGVNPLGGCLPMLLQMPVWFGLYQMIYTSVELYHTPMGLWIQDMSAPDPYYIMPILLGGLMFVQTWLTASTATMDGLQAKIMKYGMPIMFAAFMLFLPAGLVLYIFVNVALTIVQNLWIRRDMGVVKK